MIIKEIELYNFRIYKGINKIDLTPEIRKNIFIVSGKNGYGKTTFLMALVWCLYGRQMQEVDELYNKEISDQGGYSKYISNSLNRLAKKEGDTRFHVSIIFSNVTIPEVPCKEIQIRRSFDTITGISDSVEILIDGHSNELAKDVGPEIFIRDFILPKEIAKFFFFDAEKIVTLAEINTVEQRRNLSRAYSEVLGIKKYEDLKDKLEEVRLKLRELTADKKDKETLNLLNAEVKNCEIEIAENERKILEMKDEKSAKKLESNQIQEKLIRAGSAITVEELNKLRTDEETLSNKHNELQNELKDSYDIIPFAIVGETFWEVSKQLENEINNKAAKFNLEHIKVISDKVLTDLITEQRTFDGIITPDIQDFYFKSFKKLIKKHFFADIPEISDDFKVIHEFSDTEKNELNALLNHLKFSFKESFKRINGEYLQAQNEINTIRRKIKEAETKQDDPIIASDRLKKENLDKDILKIEETINELNVEIGQLKNQKIQKEKQLKELSKKLEVSVSNKSKDEAASRLINELKEFISQFKVEKKKSLEQQILKGLSTLMHKKGFIKNVEVEIIGEDIDIHLYDNRKDVIKKGDLSKGEQQMYATALLRGLVEESDIEFPVFIDSPMQKFDEEHAENIVKYFYPNVSEQVVIFPLINKELNEKEFNILAPNIAKTYLINNIDSDKSDFLPIEPKDFLKTYNKLYNNAN
ncbi:MAG: DNA sulfur modification protein DndD [Bacteroidota bacterium]